MTAQTQTLPQLLPLTIENNGCCSAKELFFSPIRYCGRQWMWMNRESNDQISQIALKALAFPFLVCATILAGGMAVIGALALPADSIPSCTEYNLRGDLSLLRKDSSNEQIEGRISERLTAAGYACSVNVESSRSANSDYYSDYVHRYVTLTNPSSTSTSRFWKVIENHFWNKNVPNLYNLHSCLCGGATVEDLERLKEVLALHGEISFSIAFDLAYISTQLGRFHCN